MKATFTQTVEIEIIETLESETEEVVSTIERFQKGEEIDVDLINDNANIYYVQFGNGDVAFIPNDLLNVTHLEEYEVE